MAIRDEKLQYDINREAAKKSALSSGKIHKYEYLADEDITIQATANNRTNKIYLFSFGKSFWKTNKNNWRSRIKTGWGFEYFKINNQLKIEDMISKISLNNDEAKKELDKVKEIEKNVDREKLVYKTIKTFGRDIYEGKITLEKANEYQTYLLAQIIDFRENTKPKSQEKNKKKKLFLKTCIIF